MPLPPLRHPAWMMVATIALFGASLTTFMAGAYGFSKTCIAMAAFTAMLSRRAIQKQPPNS